MRFGKHVILHIFKQAANMPLFSHAYWEELTIKAKLCLLGTNVKSLNKIETYCCSITLASTLTAESLLTRVNNVNVYMSICIYNHIFSIANHPVALCPRISNKINSPLKTAKVFKLICMDIEG